MGSEPKVIEKGFKWEIEVIRLYNEGLRIRDIADKVESSVSVIAREVTKLIGKENYAKRKFIYDDYLKVNDEIKAGKLQVSSSLDIDISLNKLRNNLIKTLRKNGDLTRMDISELIGRKNYTLLLKHDKEWMEKILPPRKTLLNWEQIDIEICEKISRLGKEIYNSNPARRIKRYTIPK